MTGIYADHVNGARLLPEAVAAMAPFWEAEYANPYSVHRMGQHARQAIEMARVRVAHLLGSEAREIVFASSGTEANNLAIKGIIGTKRHVPCHIVTSAVEHHSVLNVCKALEKRGVAVTYIGVDRYGTVDPEAVRQAIRPDTALITIQHANPEVGTIQPVAAIGQMARERGVCFHVDAASSVGLVPVRVANLHADLVTVAAQTFHGPKGAAALYVRRGVKMTPQWQGGAQEDGMRPGADNVPAIVGMGAAAEVASARGAEWSARLSRLRDRLIGSGGLPARLPTATLTGHPTQRLPGHVSYVVEGVDGESLTLQLSSEGVYASNGSSCSTLAMKASHVLTAMGVDSALAQGSLMLSLGVFNTDEDVDRLLEILPRVVEAIRILIPHAG